MESYDCVQKSPPFITPISGSPHGLVRECSVHHQEGSNQMTIAVLPDDVLLEVFGSYLDSPFARRSMWLSLIQTCRQWRYLVLASSYFLRLRVMYTGNRPATDITDIWPPMPIVISRHVWDGDNRTSHADNIVDTLGSEHYDRVYEINLENIPGSHSERIAAVMHKPFPTLTCLRLLWSDNGAPPVFSSSFLGGSAPRLRVLELSRTSFPQTQKLPLSANEFVVLHLWNIPDSGYISPDALVICLSSMTCLESLALGFQSPRSCPAPASRRPPPPTRTVLPALNLIWFQGVSDYFEDIVSCIDAPLLHNLRVIFFMNLIFNTISQVHQSPTRAQQTQSSDSGLFETLRYFDTYPTNSGSWIWAVLVTNHVRAVRLDAFFYSPGLSFGLPALLHLGTPRHQG
ncbi:hypothetical protein F5148DRAFT_541992 [Russula earlei]|uniref:Uncharacterized protein n=1 Tax=Russula earlei TaxID=71964 RepID=A0ACC0UHY7_9AGAM|nr:hypothetical protein F5148DRAFT_541992 [Russula earlei]